MSRRVPELWPQASAVLLATGPSLSSEALSHVEAACRAKRLRVICVNDAYRVAPWADALYACDKDWWDVHYDACQALSLRKWTQDARVAQTYGDVAYIRGNLREGFSTDPTYIHCGRHGGYQALNLAFLLGARRIALLGYDLTRVPRGERNHYFGRHPTPLRNEQDYSRFVAAYEGLNERLMALGCEVRNATVGSGLREFPFTTPREAVEWLTSKA